MKAHVLIQTVAGKKGSLLQALRKAEEVQSADLINGPYDIIATVEAADLGAISKVIVEKVYAFKGITRISTDAPWSSPRATMLPARGGKRFGAYVRPSLLQVRGG